MSYSKRVARQISLSDPSNALITWPGPKQSPCQRQCVSCNLVIYPSATAHDVSTRYNCQDHILRPLFPANFTVQVVLSTITCSPARRSPAGSNKTPAQSGPVIAVGSELNAIRMWSTPVGACTLVLPEYANAAVRFPCFYCSYNKSFAVCS